MIKFDDKYCYSTAIGNDGITADALNIYRQEISNVISELAKTDKSTPYYKLLHGFDNNELITPLKQTAAKLKTYKDVIIVSMGGATLNPRSITALRMENNPSTQLHFLYTTDPYTFNQMVSRLDLKRTACLVISNSGKTTETIAATGSLINHFRENGITNIADHFHFLIGKDNNPLRNIASELGSNILDYDEEVGGRFSTFSSVGILPGLIADLDMESMLRGANDLIADFWQNKANSIAARAALSLYYIRKPIAVFLAYLDVFTPFIEWYAQVISESLGKDGKGFTPVRGIGPMDQHSMLQLYLQGPKDKVYTFIYADNLNLKNIKIANDIQPEYLASKSLLSINNAEYQATLQSILNNKLPTRTITLERIDEYNFGQLMMLTTFETVLIARLMGLNPFDQPGVEQIKVEARKILANS